MFKIIFPTKLDNWFPISISCIIITISIQYKSDQKPYFATISINPQPVRDENLLKIVQKDRQIVLWLGTGGGGGYE